MTQDPKRIYVVEDEALIAMLIKERLKHLGYEVCGAAARGEVAVEQIPILKPDLILMDINLAGKMNGIEVARAVRSGLDVPVVFLTAYSDNATIRLATEAGPFGYLVKPFEERELNATIQMAFYKHDAEQKLRAANDRLEELTRVDALTGTLNRRALDETLPRELKAAARRAEPITLVFIDVDDFKSINDTHGHVRGDEVLSSIGAILRAEARETDYCFRYAGDEFCVVLPNCREADARDGYCGRVSAAVAKHLGGVTLSLGIAQTGPIDYLDEAALMALADARMFEAKRLGKTPKADSAGR